MSQNDPQWGGRRNGPPDLDDIFRNAKNKLSGLFGSGGNPQPGGNGAGLTGVVSILAVVALLWAASGSYVVGEQQNAVITRFGKYVETVETAGLHWHMPWPIERRELVNVTEIRSLDVGASAQASSGQDEAMMLTGDQNIIEVQLEVQYTLKSARDFLFNNYGEHTDKNGNPDGADLVKQAAETAIREVVGKNQVDFVLNEGRGKIGEDTKDLMQQLLDKYGTGIQIARVNISDVQPPNEVQASFADAVKARQDKARLINEGTAYANDVIPRASGMAARLQEEAQGYKQQVVARAEGDASRFKQIAAEYAKAPQVTRDRMYLDTMQQIFENTTKVLVDQKSGNNLLYLPLDKLMQMNATATAPEAAKAAVTEVQPTPAPIAQPMNNRDERDGR